MKIEIEIQHKSMVNNQMQKQKNESVEEDKYGVQFVFDSMYEKYKERLEKDDNSTRF